MNNGLIWAVQIVVLSVVVYAILAGFGRRSRLGHDSPKSSAAPATWRCTTCDHENPISQTHCEKCGQVLPSQGGLPVTIRKKLATPMLIVGGLVALNAFALLQSGAPVPGVLATILVVAGITLAAVGLILGWPWVKS